MKTDRLATAGPKLEPSAQALHVVDARPAGSSPGPWIMWPVQQRGEHGGVGEQWRLLAKAAACSACCSWLTALSP
jgi:hypothetical protein